MQIRLLDIYEKLHSSYGIQNWWPSTLEGKTTPEYHGKKPNNRMRFEIALGAILTQNTTWTNAQKAITNLNVHALISPEKILSHRKEVLLEAIRPSRYYNQKLKKLINLSEWWLKYFPDIIVGSKDTKYIDKVRESVLTVNGVGPETVDSILLYAFDLPSFVIDTYTKRIMARHYNFSPNIKYETLRDKFMNELPHDIQLYKEFHALFVELGKNHCKKSICLPACPLR
jgi:endonuclease-3 related protein